MISDTKLQLILTLYKNDKLTFEEVKTLLQEEKNFTDPFQPINPWQNPNPWINPIVTFQDYTTSENNWDEPTPIWKKDIHTSYNFETPISTDEFLKNLLG